MLCKLLRVKESSLSAKPLKQIVDLICKHGAAFQVLAKTHVQQTVRAAAVLHEIEKECSRRADRKNNYAAKHSTMFCILGRLS
jgi:hypothetical protein